MNLSYKYAVAVVGSKARYKVGVPLLRLLIASCVTISGTAFAAEPYPSKPITLIVPFTAGGIVDAYARAVGRKLTGELGQPVIIDNRPGAGGTIATDYAARAAPDGYTLMVGTQGTHGSNLALYKNVHYDPVKDFIAIHTILTSAAVLVTNPSRPYQSVQQLVAYAKNNPDKLSFSSPGPGTGSHLASELFLKIAGIKMLHIPYKGTSQSLTDLMSGVVDVTFDYPASTLAYIKAGKLRPLAVASTARLPTLPDVPTLEESGIKGAQAMVWAGLFAPRNTPIEITNRLNSALARIMVSPDMAQLNTRNGMLSSVMGGAEFQKYVAQQALQQQKLVREIGVTLD